MRSMSFMLVLAVTACGGSHRTEAPEPGLAVAPHEYAVAGIASATAQPVGNGCDYQRDLLRSDIDAMLMDSQKLMKQARIVPVPRDGGIGMKLQGILLDSPLRAWGFDNGDEILSVNDLAIGSPEEALKLYASVREATSLRIVTERAGTPRTVCLQVAP